jgi:hypothetical protein
MSMFLDLLAALLAWGMAAAWVLTGHGNLPPDRDPSADRGGGQGPARNPRAAHRASTDMAEDLQPHQRARRLVLVEESRA